MTILHNYGVYFIFFVNDAPNVPRLDPPTHPAHSGAAVGLEVRHNTMIYIEFLHIDPKKFRFRGQVQGGHHAVADGVGPGEALPHGAPSACRLRCLD